MDIIVGALIVLLVVGRGVYTGLHFQTTWAAQVDGPPVRTRRILWRPTGETLLLSVFSLIMRVLYVRHV
jgi:hypothetical protein